MRPLGVTLAAYFQFIRAFAVALSALGVYFVRGTSPVELKPAQLGTDINKSARSTLGLSLSTANEHPARTGTLSSLMRRILGLCLLSFL